MERRTILQMVALGRLSAAEAERLLLARSWERETAWMLIACVALGLLTHAEALLQMGHAVSVLSKVLGGMS